MTKEILFFCKFICICLSIPIQATSIHNQIFLQKQVPGNDFICGNEFKKLANITLEKRQAPFSAANEIKNNDIIFVETDVLGYFFDKIFPKIKHKFILISHDSDDSAPYNFLKYLDSDKLIAWFGQNCDYDEHPKFHPIPIGIANSQWTHGNQQNFYEVIKKNAKRNTTQHLLMYINIPRQAGGERQLALKEFKNKNFVKLASFKPPKEFLEEMSNYAFVLSPFGNGLDCHRTWEALYMGCIPVVTSSTLDQLYEKLPVIIVEDWDEVTEEFLKNKYREFSSKIDQLNFSKLFMKYWKEKITSYQK